MTIQHNTLIEKLVANAKKAQETINNYSQEQVDELILAVAWEIIQPENNQELSEMAVKDTGLGNIEDKKRKNRRKTLGLLRDLKGVKTVGIIDQNVQKGIGSMLGKEVRFYETYLASEGFIAFQLKF